MVSSKRRRRATMASARVSKPRSAISRLSRRAAGSYKCVRAARSSLSKEARSISVAMSYVCPLDVRLKSKNQSEGASITIVSNSEAKRILSSLA